jgi:hypothetical protein
MYGRFYMCRRYIAILREFSECLVRGAVDRVLWMGVLCLATWCVASQTHNTPIHNIQSTAPQLSYSQKALGKLLEEDNVMPKHVVATIHN